MPIDFHAEENRYSYASREVDESWLRAITQVTQVQNRVVYDIGCGGGIYARAWASLGAKRVIGVDYSLPAIETAREQTSVANVTFQTGDAFHTGLPANSAQIVFARALIHHLDDVQAFFAEAYRLLIKDGHLLVQARTHEDVLQPSSAQHIRGYLFEKFPRLLAAESRRRHSDDEVNSYLHASGFREVDSFAFWETDAVYPNFAEFARNLRRRRAASLLHELTDEELGNFADFLATRLGNSDTEIVLRSRYTVWQGMKP